MSRFPASVSDSSRTILTSTGLKGDTGDSAIYAYPAVPVVPIPCDNDGSNPVYTSATSEVLIYQDGNLLTGWTLAYVSGSSCTGTVNNSVEPRTATIANVSAPSGYATFTATKTGTTLRFRLYFAKMPEGAKGDTGDTGATGSTGSTGATGAAGSDGTGLVVVHKTISVSTGSTVTKQDYGDGNLQINYSGAHGLVLGDYVWVFQTSVYDGGYFVTEVVDSDSVKLNVSYDATAGTVTAYDAELFRSFADTDPQMIAFNNIIPHGAKVMEWQLLYTDDNSGAINPVTVSIGESYNGNLAALGDTNWLNGAYLSAEGDLVSRSRTSTIPMNIAGAMDLFMFFVSSGEQWSTLLANFEVEFFIAYINYNPTWTP